MKEQLISFDTAKLAKEGGFNIPCFYYYEDNNLKEPYLENGSSTDVDFRVDLTDLLENMNNKHLSGDFVSAPTQSLLQKWLREVRNIHIRVDDFIDDETGIEWDYEIVIIGTGLDE